MNPEIKQRWVYALRNDYKQQSDGKLRTNNGFCCLGVLCDLYLKDHKEEWELVSHSDESQSQDYYKCFDSSEILPRSVCRWAGLSSNNPILQVTEDPEGGEFETYYDDDELLVSKMSEDIACLNDTGYTFSSIADLIEKQL